MTTITYCGMCGKTVADEKQLKGLYYDDQIMANVCIRCGSKLSTSFKSEIAQTQLRIDKLYRELGSAEEAAIKEHNTPEVEPSTTAKTAKEQTKT